QYLTIYHHGDFDSIDQAYILLEAYAVKHNLTLGDYFYENLLVNEITVKDINEFIFEISVLIIT
ncbi:MAG TPA: MerR family transcriptional regulator, partial [Erysipelothrix sp.]